MFYKELFEDTNNQKKRIKYLKYWNMVQSVKNISISLTLPCIMLKNGQTSFKMLECEHGRILKYVWPFFNIMDERVA